MVIDHSKDGINERKLDELREYVKVLKEKKRF
jgi:hypothetical protein